MLASGNFGKLKELNDKLGHIADVVPQSDFDIETPEETGSTFVENALIKASYVAELTGLPALADDSGLSVDALDGAPGIYSARYAGLEASDADNNAKLLHNLKGVPTEARTAAFHCVLALVYPDNTEQPILCDGVWRGKILTEPKGSNGFGYDPIFQPEGLNMSSAELSAEHKNQISHRGKAMAILTGRLSEPL